MEQNGQPIPAATASSKIYTTGDDFITAISVDTEYYDKIYSEKLYANFRSKPHCGEIMELSKRYVIK